MSQHHVTIMPLLQLLLMPMLILMQMLMLMLMLMLMNDDVYQACQRASPKDPTHPTLFAVAVMHFYQVAMMIMMIVVIIIINNQSDDDPHDP